MRKAFVGLGAILFLPVLAFFVLISEEPPSFEQVRHSFQRSEAILLDRYGNIIHEQRAETKGRRLDWVPLDQISPALVSAITFVEDKRFYTHRGIDWRSTGAAAFTTITLGRLRGASTITMQLASLLNMGLRPRGPNRSLKQKLKQMLLARSLEKRWTKSQILEAYLNLLTFRGELQGIAAASQGMFKKEPHGLNQLESLVLASLPRAPAASEEQIVSRSSHLSSSMKIAFGQNDLREAVRQALPGPYIIRPMVALAPHVTLQLLGQYRRAKQRQALTLRSTLDGKLQRFAMETLRAQILSLQSQNVRDGAVLVADNKTGDILAYVGNIGDEASARYVDGVTAARQAGSTLKPFLYALAFDNCLLTAASLVDDSPLNIPEGSSIFSPSNYDNQFRGLIPARMALASSINVPAVRTLQLVGVEAFLQKLRELGVRDLLSADFYGPSLALGTADVSLWELVNAYRTLANAGTWGEMRLTQDARALEKSRPVFSKEASFIVSDILSDRESRSTTFGLESPLATRYWTAVKTGTSKDMRDNWCIGYSDRYTVGVWVGNFDGEPMWNVSGMSGAAPAWVEIMNWLHRDRTSTPPQPPRELVARRAEFPTSQQPRMEWFLQGTEPTTLGQSLEPIQAKVLYPAPGTIVALDPDIPGQQQAILFDAKPRDSRLHWELNDTTIGSAGNPLSWSPRPGTYTLALVDPRHRVIDTVGFEVKGDLNSNLSQEDIETDPDERPSE